MSISVLSGSEIVVSRTDIFHLLFELTVDGGRQNLTGCHVDGEWKGQVETIRKRIMEPGVSPFGLVGTQETTENKTDKFSLLWIAFRSPSVCGWVFGEDNQQVNSEFSEKNKTR